MRVCIIGVGKVGFYLARTLREDNIDVAVIEIDARHAKRCADQLDIPVVQADGTTMAALSQVDCAACDALVSTCGRDESNLVACQLAKNVFHVPKTAARVNNPKNVPVLRQLGVDIVACGTTMLALQMERLVETEGLREIMSLANGQASLFEMNLPAGFPLSGRTLAEIKMPQKFTIVSITREGTLIYPHGDSQLLAGDKIICFSPENILLELCEKWGMTPEAAPKRSWL